MYLLIYLARVPRDRPDSDLPRVRARYHVRMTSPPRTPASLRSARWLAPEDFRSFGHCSRVMQMGYSDAD